MYGLKKPSKDYLYPGMNGVLPPEMNIGTRIDRWIYHSPLLSKHHRIIGALLILLTALALVYPAYKAIELTWIHPTFTKETYVTATVTKCTEKPSISGYLYNYSGKPVNVYDIEFQYELSGELRTSVLQNQKEPMSPGTTFQKQFKPNYSRKTSISKYPSLSAWFMLFFAGTISVFFFVVFARYMKFGRVENARDYQKYHDKIISSKKDKKAKLNPNNEPLEYYRDESSDPQKPATLFSPGLYQDDSFLDDIVASYDPDEVQNPVQNNDRFRPYDPDGLFQSNGLFYNEPDDNP